LTFVDDDDTLDVNDVCYRRALKNFERCVKPGGVLLIDHRNYDYIIDRGATPAKSIYYNVSICVGDIN
jgi:hypothetical protein